MTKEFKRRIVRLENRLDSSHGPETLEGMLAAFERGAYGETSIMAVVVSIMSNGGSMDYLCGELPDKLIDAFAKCLKKTNDDSDDAAGHLPDERESNSL